MKYIVSILIVFFSLGLYHSHAACSVDFEWDKPISELVDNCMEKNETLVVRTDGKDLNAGIWTNRIINDLIARIWGILGVVAVLMIVYGAFLMTLSGGDEEKIKKWKDLVKWTVLWFIALVAAGWIISLIITTIFEFSIGAPPVLDTPPAVD